MNPFQTRALRPMTAEFLVVLGIVGVIMLANLWTADRSPTVWGDEVMFAEPAANYVLGNGMTSRAWVKVTPDRTWAGNAPLHTWLLVPWMQLTGLTPTAVRAVNFVYMGFAVMAFWWAARRSQLIQTPWLGAMIVVLWLFDRAVSFSYRGGRYDALGMLLIGLAAALATLEGKRIRIAGMTAVGVLVPFAGLQLLPYLTAVMAIAVTYYGRAAVRMLAPLAAGVAVGGLLLFATFSKMGIWSALLDAVGFYISDEPASGSWSLRAEALLKAYPETFLMDPLLCAALAVLGVSWFFQRQGEDGERSKWDQMVVWLAVSVPFLISLCYIFRHYYIWMISIPAVLAAAHVWERNFWLAPGGRTGAVRNYGLATAGLLVAGAMFGLPARLAVTALEWEQRDYAPVEALVRRSVRPTDVVFADWQAFYPLARENRVAFYPDYKLTAEEKESLTMLIISPAEFDRWTGMLGGKWRVVDGMQSRASGLSSRLYDLRVYSRVRPVDQASLRSRSAR